MRIKILPILLTFVQLFNISCEKKREYLLNVCPNVSEKSSFVLSNSILKIPVKDSMPTSYPKLQILDDRYLIGRAKQKYQLDIYDIIEKKYIKSIKIDKFFVPNFSSFYVHNLDSIFIAQDPHTLSLIDNNGKVINKWILDNAPINWHLKETTNVPLYYFENDRENINYFDKKTGNLHLTLTNTDIYYFADRDKFQLHHVFNINTKKWVKSFGKLTEAYSDDSKMTKQYLPFQSHPFCLVKGDSSYVSFPISHNVLIFNNKTGALIKEKCVSSTYIKKLFPPIDYETEHQEERNFFISSPFYGSLSYHKKAGIFSRIAVHEQNVLSPDGKLNKHLNKTVSVITFDKNLNKIDEFILDSKSPFSNFGDYNSLFISYPLTDGFLGTLKESQLKTESEFRHSVLFKFTKK